jgi:SNF2 family DNA or RNA helicase
VKEEVHHGGIGRCLTVSGKKLGALVAKTVSAGWHVEANGAAYRAPGAFRAAVRSSIDWFELTARVQFGDTDVPLADLLAASRSGETTIPLPGGDIGMIPADLLARVAPVAAGATIGRDGTLRFARSQTALIDALLAAAPQPDIDATFERARSELRTFDRVQPADPPPTFRGTLREYQREGLGWLHFLRRFELGGCLADDMGLGKTVQVLALLESRRQANATPHRPSIVVVPRSLIFNWLSEARRFAPELRMLDFAHPARRFEDIAETDVVLTTYGTLRRDSARLSAVEFDYAILDEAQAIKTAGSASAKAARLLRARHRLAITGTPIENRIEELWSLFDFLNPGMLGARTTFAALARLQSNDIAASDRSILSRALRPVILRRTKTQVAPELPARIEQTLLVELEGTQRRRYDHLLATYRESVLERVDRVGLGKARMHILEALLRLRQAACHLALVDKRDSATASAKLDALIPALEEVVAEGHKAIVFSQFTQFLALVRPRLESAGLVHEYLDGKTLDRQARVDRFQSDASCSIFLISLKAGGHGLNLTAADYVYILDPWWNPAVEAQAIDRAHRIGQTRRVIATRIVASGTIEEKILELQASKRALADAILGQDQSALSNIGREELEMLLSPGPTTV